MWTMGPSTPAGAPEAITMHTPVTFTTNVWRLNAPLMSHPFKNAFVSGMPVEAA